MSNTAAMPRGVEAGGVGARIVAYVIDAIPPIIISGLLGLVVRVSTDASMLLVASIVGALLVLGWGIFVWWGYAVRGAGPGMRAMGLQLVGLRDGRPIGWGRVFLRQLILSVLIATVLGAILLFVFLLTHPQRQGWHDLAVKSVVVKAPKRSGAGTSGMGALAKQQLAASSTTTVGLPPRLAQQQGGFAGQTAPGSWQESSAPAGPITAIPTFGAPVQAPLGGPAAQPVSQLSAGPYGQPMSQPSAAPYGQPMSQPSAIPYGQPVSQPSATPYGQPVSQPSAAPYGRPVSQPSAAPLDQHAGHPIGQPTTGPASEEPPPVQPPASEFGQPFTPPSATYGTPVSQANSGIGGAHTLPTVSQPSAASVGVDTEAAAWRLTFDDGRTVDVHGKVLIGRDPVTQPGEAASLVGLGEGSKKVSKTHLLVDRDERGLFLIDRGSTNGTAIVLDNGDFSPCVAGEVVRLSDGQGVSFGDHWFTVARVA